MASFQIRSMMSCGIKELSNISSLATPEDVVRATAVNVAEFNDYYAHNPAFLLFSGVVGQRKRVYSSHLHADRSDDYGQALADYILAGDLGTVSVSQEAINHNGNTLRVWLWAPKWEKLKKIWEASHAAEQAAGVQVTQAVQLAQREAMLQQPTATEVQSNHTFTHHPTANTVWVTDRIIQAIENE